MKRRYGDKVKRIRLEPGSFAWYHCPRQKLGRYHKWRRLCEVCRIEQRFSDDTYSIRITSRSKPIIAHIDPLRPFEGDLPVNWADCVNREVRNSLTSKLGTANAQAETSDESGDIRGHTTNQSPVAAAESTSERGATRGHMTLLPLDDAKELPVKHGAIRGHTTIESLVTATERQVKLWS